MRTPSRRHPSPSRPNHPTSEARRPPPKSSSPPSRRLNVCERPRGCTARVALGCPSCLRSPLGTACRPRLVTLWPANGPATAARPVPTPRALPAVGTAGGYAALTTAVAGAGARDAHPPDPPCRGRAHPKALTRRGRPRARECDERTPRRRLPLRGASEEHRWGGGPSLKRAKVVQFSGWSTAYTPAQAGDRGVELAGLDAHEQVEVAPGQRAADRGRTHVLNLGPGHQLEHARAMLANAACTAARISASGRIRTAPTRRRIPPPRPDRRPHPSQRSPPASQPTTKTPAHDAPCLPSRRPSLIALPSSSPPPKAPSCAASGVGARLGA
jgi:hypothetical protein